MIEHIAPRAEVSIEKEKQKDTNINLPDINEIENYVTYIQHIINLNGNKPSGCQEKTTLLKFLKILM